MAAEIDNAYKKPSPTAGNGLFAKKACQEGELIFGIPRPMLTELNSSGLCLYCSNCFVRSNDGLPGSRDIKISACSACKVVSYCSKQCQSIAWKRQHKAQCPLWKGLPRASEIPHAVRLVAQALAARKNGRISDKEWEAFESLPGHVDKLRERDDFETHAAMAMGALKYSGVETSSNFDKALAIYARILTNSLTITTAALHPIGVGVDPFASCANHSCEPNAFVVLEGTKLCYRALRPISKDEEIFMSYVDDKCPFLQRQKELRDRYYFDCKCSKCQKGCDTMEDRLRQPSPEQKRKISRYASALTTGKPDRYVPEDSPLPAVDEFLIYKLARQLPRRIRKPRDSISPLSPDLYALEAYAFGYVESTGGPKTVDLEPLLPVIWLLSSTEVWPNYRQPFPDLVEDFLRRTASLEGPSKAGFHNLGTVWLFAVFRYILIDPILYPAHHPLRTLHVFSLANWSMTLLLDSEADQRKVVELALGGPLARRIDFPALAKHFLSEAQASVVKSHGPQSRFAYAVIAQAPLNLFGETGSPPGYAEHKRPERLRLLEDVAKVVDEKKSSWFRQIMEGRFMEDVLGKRPLKRSDHGVRGYLSAFNANFEKALGGPFSDSEDEDKDWKRDYNWLSSDDE